MNGLNNPIGYKSNQTLEQPFIMNPFRFGGGTVGGWKELDRTTLVGSGSTIDVTGLDNKQYLMVLRNILTASADVTENFNSDTGSNYSRRYMANGGGDVASVNQSTIGLNYSGGDKFIVDYISNLSSKEKLVISNSSEEASAGASNYPNRMEVVGKWANTSNAIDEINTSLTGGSYDAGSEVVVLGWDSSDTHSDTDNFWQELASVDYDASTPDELVTGTIPAKKYLFVQAYINGTAVGLQDNTSFRFNGDTGNNYTFRNSNDGAADTTVINYNYLRTLQSDTGNKSLSSTFIVNNSANEKLLISNAVKFTTAGGSTAPNRNDMVGKWTNTSSQITDIKYWQSGSGSFDTGSTLKVWGHD